jgi:hypothetical protein
MRRAAAIHLTSLALLVFLPSLIVAKAEPTQLYKRGLQVEVLDPSLPRTSGLAIPRSATLPVPSFLPTTIQHSFANEFYGNGFKSEESAVEAQPLPDSRRFGFIRKTLASLAKAVPSFRFFHL